MLGIKKATSAVEESATAVRDLARMAEGELSELSSQFRTEMGIIPYVVLGTAALSVVALIVALMALDRANG